MSERDSESARERGEKAGWQRGHSDSEERRTRQGLVTGPTGPPLSTSWHSVVHIHTHTHTHGWPTALPAALSVTV